ncbi:MAG: large subunit ribosomal protein [Thermoproteota archaeon]|nr:large subunit ribosomal protein [Thermoproteota archaeon]
MSEIKIFRVKGEIHKPDYRMKFSKDIRALKQEDAVERAFTDIGGQHNVKRFHLKVTSVEEIKIEDVKNPIVRMLSEG